ncbi:cytochrome d ubiquinol oxidase subunit II [Leuconostoc citreum]|uniref:Cytochrome d ubiquinol oxidase, subunit II n=1 Tax=Leuconostoc citreum (strain KM20) TaxID=349519 RepID=B1MXQ3_LEUCK|nr:cytochrome d ubiquinol oxidase subunit II [Leuconostoc citreum]ACA82305.1 Cytochrome d ubiquinol oxidase, subunit II [Leuconostoc citreum KM20]MCS8583447.1 cytochrome d ubiquinol oxidase subunit II [Leuconostoc citreum]MCS8601096.1 cytochrome d ubiquinol oxidase subunit II [Leuconostoc citreum]QGN61302.1 cytochrome d ubiquinol oxidase subunit II [Leuconostoc citreum]QQE98581.1 cytochrome d ubiquinol oxidase subunit II [Leuconostoc citreum]
MTILEIIWFVLIGVLWAGFFFLEGFDFGIGMQFALNARDQKDREALYQAIGPNWDANEVWLVTAGGATFAAFPAWYASLFSGFYLMLFIVLLSLIYRGVSFEFREHMPTVQGTQLWERLIALTSFLVPFFLGMIFTAMVSGMPIDARGNLSAGFFDYVTPFSLVGGVAVSLMSYVHGLNYTRLRIDGKLRTRALKQLEYLYPILLAGEALFAVLLFFYTDFIQTQTVWTLSILVVIVLTTVIGWLLAIKQKMEKLPFVLSGLTLVEVVVLLFVGLFPRVMVANNPLHTLNIMNTSSSTYTLKVMTIVVVTALPVTLGYQIWSFWVFRKRIVSHKVVE